MLKDEYYKQGITFDKIDALVIVQAPCHIERKSNG